MQDFFTKIQEIKLENALYIVATPIGNLLDVTLRALQVLSKVDFIACEDTRVSTRLLNAYNIKSKKLLTYNDHNSEKMCNKILHLLLEGKSLAIISDAGTPLISDPGHKLINFLHSEGQKIISLPGASSLVSAVCASGVACNNFLFLGFLPSSEVQREKILRNLPISFTFVFFESPNRVIESLKSVEKVCGNRKACVARELTKIHEEIVFNDIKGLLQLFKKCPNKLRGEFVIIIEKIAKSEKTFDEKDLQDKILDAFSCGKSIKDLSQDLAERYRVNKKEVYQRALTYIKR